MGSPDHSAVVESAGADAAVTDVSPSADCRWAGISAALVGIGPPVLPLLVRRYERGGLIVPSNKNFADWRKVFNDHVLVTAILNGLLHHARRSTLRARVIDGGKRKEGLFG